MWIVRDSKDPGNVAEGFAQGAYQAYQLSGIKRDGRRLDFSEVEVSISEVRTQQKYRQFLFDFLIAISRSRRPGKRRARRINGKLNGHRR